MHQKNNRSETLSILAVYLHLGSRYNSSVNPLTRPACPAASSPSESNCWLFRDSCSRIVTAVQPKRELLERSNQSEVGGSLGWPYGLQLSDSSNCNRSGGPCAASESLFQWCRPQFIFSSLVSIPLHRQDVCCNHNYSNSLTSSLTAPVRNIAYTHPTWIIRLLEYQWIHGR